MELVRYLNSGKTLEDLTNEFKIKVVQSTVYPELFLFKYNQISSPMDKLIVQESRGVILNSEDNWAPVCRPYNKFFNYNEPNAHSIDWDSAKVYDKLDGSILTLYYYKGKWNVSTSGNPDASGTVCTMLNEDTTFRQLFWDTFNSLKYQLPVLEHTDSCFMFELMTPYNKIVVQHATNKLVLHGTRNNITGVEGEIEWLADMYGWSICPTYPLNTIEEVVEATAQLNPTVGEGYVIRDKNFNRVKVKSISYVALSHTKDSMSPRNILRIFLANEGDEVLSYFPEYTELYERIKDAYHDLIVEITCTIIELEVKRKKNGGTLTRKEVGLATKHLFYNGLLFPIIFDGKSVKEVVRKQPFKRLEKWLNK